MQLPLTDDRAVRMIQALLAAADPLNRVEQGSPPSSYDPLATLILSALRNGADVRRIVVTVTDHGSVGLVPLGIVVGFAEAVLDWWANAASRWGEPVAV